MTGYTKAARSIIQGVSQQDDLYMIEGQCRAQTNMIPSPLEGLVKRPSTEYAFTYDFLDINATYNWFDVEIAGDNLQFILGTDRLFVVRNLVLEQTILFDGDTVYYLDDITKTKIYYINNKIYLLNPEKVIETVAEDAITHATTCSIWAVGISQNKTYTATITVRSVADDTIVYTTDASFDVTNVADTKTTIVISNLYAGIDGSTWFTKGSNQDVISCRLLPEHQADYYLDVVTTDDASNTYLKSYSNEISNAESLPRFALEGMRATVSVSEGNIDNWYLNFKATSEDIAFVGETVKIGVDYEDRTRTIFLDTDTETSFSMVLSGQRSVVTTVTSIASNFYDFFYTNGDPLLIGSTVNIGDWYGTTIVAKRKTSANVPVSGTWKEAALPGTNNFNTSTLPIVLDSEVIYYEDKDPEVVWSVEQLSWLPRQVGDEESAPFPKFVGKPIRSLYEHAGRLVAVTDDEIEVTNTNEFNNWFRETATQLLTTDPFGLTSSRKRGSLLTPITLNGELFIWGDQDQFKLTGSSVGITTSALTGVSSYTSSLTEPIVTGDVIHFISKTDKYNVLYSFAATSSTVYSYTAEAVSDQIATKIPGTVKQLLSSYNMNTLMILTEEEPSKVYLYNYYYNNGKLQQSAWSELDFDFPIEKIFIADNQYQIIMKYNLNYHLVTLDLKDLVRDNYVHMDMLQSLTFVDGYATPSIVDEDFLVVDYTDYKGKTIPFELQQDGSIYCATLKDKPSYVCYIGKTFKTLLVPRLVVESSEQGNIKFTSTVKLNTLGLVTGVSGSFDVEISGPGFNHTTQYNSSSMSRTIYSFNSQAATFNIPVRARSDQNTVINITSDSHMPFTITGMFYRYRTSQRGILI